MIKHIEIDENAIYNTILSRLAENYTLRFADYRDEIGADIVQRCLDEKSLEPLFEEDCWSEQQWYGAREEVNRILADLIKESTLTHDQAELFKECEEYNDLILEVRQRDESEVEKDVFIQTKIHARVTVHSNYDCWLPLWETGSLQGEEGALHDLMTILRLNPAKVKQSAIKRGVPCSGRFPNLQHREGKEIVDYDGFVECLQECPNYGLWNFFGLFDMDALWNSGMQNLDDLVIPEGTICTMFNNWNGGGSLSFTKTIRPISVRALSAKGRTRYDKTTVCVDERIRDDKHSYGYSSGEVYGGELSSKEILVA